MKSPKQTRTYLIESVERVQRRFESNDRFTRYDRIVVIFDFFFYKRVFVNSRIEFIKYIHLVFFFCLQHVVLMSNALSNVE